MNSKISILCVVCICFVGNSAEVLGANSLREVVVSTVRIIGGLCYANNGANRNNQPLINQFFGCYDQAPGKPQFVRCQTQVFGGPLDNTRAVTASCGDQRNLIPYASCLRREFENVGLDMTSTVLTLNACQSRVLGIN